MISVFLAGGWAPTIHATLLALSITLAAVFVADVLHPQAFDDAWDEGGDLDHKETLS